VNKTLRKLEVSGFSSVGGSVIPALREGLGNNSTLEILELVGALDGAHVMEASFHIAVVEAFQANKALKTLRLGCSTPKLANDEVKHLTSESLPTLDSDYEYRMGGLRSILRLNGAGRGYLLDGHGSFISKGVDVLSAVSDDVNCVLLHLMENPELCSRDHSSCLVSEWYSLEKRTIWSNLVLWVKRLKAVAVTSKKH
jgi:hypothetical protein